MEVIVMKRSFMRITPFICLTLALLLIAPAVAVSKDTGKAVGKLERVTNKFKTFCLMTKSGPEIIKFNDETVIKQADVDQISKLRSGIHLIVNYVEKGDEKIAKTVTVKVVKVDAKDVIETQAIVDLVDKGPEKGNYVLVDARPSIRFEQGHIPTSVSLPFHNWDSTHEKVLPESKDTLLVFYCGGVTCSLSPKSANKAKELGYKNVKVYVAGMPAWKKAGKPAVTNPESVQKLVAQAGKAPKEPPFFIIIDLRSKDKRKDGFIPYSTAMTSKEVINNVPDFPKYKKVRLILYTDKGITEDATKALKQLYAWKYKSPAILAGGFEAWKEAGYKVAKGDQPTKIAFKKKPAKGEISAEEFMKMVEKKPEDKVIVDVRPPEEFNQGAIPGAVNIPFEKMKKEQADLPKDKEIITYCNTGAICYIADQFLKGKGYKSRHLNATVKYKDGKPVISE
jgi:rhodanese-related sulfurtransferase